jgi:hypothetical protein
MPDHVDYDDDYDNDNNGRDSPARVSHPEAL